MMYLKNKIIHFVVFYCLYINVEVHVRALHGELIGFQGIKYLSFMGFSTPYMGILAGFLSLIIAFLLDNPKYFNFKIWQKLLIGGILISCVELLSGIILNIIFHLNIWYYNGINFMHQISLLTFLEWTFIITPLIIWLDSQLTFYLYHEDKPIQLWSVYKDLFTGK